LQKLKIELNAYYYTEKTSNIYFIKKASKFSQSVKNLLAY